MWLICKVHQKIKCQKLKFNTHSGKECYALLHPDIGIIQEYQDYLVLKIETGSSANTIRNKAQDLKKFFEYCFAFTETSKIIEFRIEATLLHSIIMSFPSYLSQAQNSLSEFALFAARTNNSKPVSAATRARILSTVNDFLDKSSELHSNLKGLNEIGLIDIDVAQDELISGLNQRRKMRAIESNQINSKSILASVMRGGAKYVSSKTFRLSNPNKSPPGSLVKKAFPLAHIFSLINPNLPPFEICLWSLLAGTGIRLSEALQLLLRDVDIDNECVYVYDPELREPLYADLTDAQRKKLVFKGRTTHLTYFIEPFKSIFFDNIGSYLLTREVTGATHEVLFVSRSPNNLGEPLFDTDEVGRRFSLAVKELGLIEHYTPHSLRHFYGVFCLNFLPTINGDYGLKLSTVKNMMGHASEDSTMQYAVVDELVLKATIEIANKLISNGTLDPKIIIENTIKRRLGVLNVLSENK